MRKLALSDEILMQIEKPARYIGNELNSVVKDNTSQNESAMCHLLLQNSAHYRYSAQVFQ